MSVISENEFSSMTSFSPDTSDGDLTVRPSNNNEAESKKKKKRTKKRHSPQSKSTSTRPDHVLSDGIDFHELQSLKNRITILESMVVSLTEKLSFTEIHSHENVLQPSKIDQDTQTSSQKEQEAISSSPKDISYADMVKKIPSKTSTAGTIYCAKDCNEKPSHLTTNRTKSKKGDVKYDVKCDVKYDQDSNTRMSSSNLVTSKAKSIQGVHTAQRFKTNRSDLSDEEESGSDNHASVKSPNPLPEVWVLHDSTLNGVDLPRLGNSYDFNPIDIRVSKAEDIEDALIKTFDNLDHSPDSIVIHCGANNLRNSDATPTSSILTDNIKKAQSRFPDSKILFSEVTPIKNSHMNIQRNLLNAQMSANTTSFKGVSTIHHSHMTSNMIRRNDILHPNKRGSSFLAGNIGRAVRASLWSRSKYNRRLPRNFPHHFTRPDMRGINHSYNSRQYFSNPTLQRNFWSNRFQILNDY